MTIGILGRRYGGALLNLAKESGRLDKVRSDVRELAAMWHDNRELQSIFENPNVPATSRRQVLRDIAAQSGMDPLLRDTLLLVSDRGRMNQLDGIIESFEAMAEAGAGHVQAEVTTASELPEAYFNELQKTLERVTGKQVSIKKRVDPTLLGGVVTRIGDQVFDGSLSHRLSELKHELSR
jgi:F-type H+-transporting ATPase subunit delta